MAEAAAVDAPRPLVLAPLPAAAPPPVLSAADSDVVEALIERLLEARARPTCTPVEMTEADVTHLLELATPVLAAEPSLLTVAAPVVVVGDIHGQFYDLLSLFDRVGHVPTARYLFMGDYVDRGRYGLECIMLLLALKVRFPEHVFLLRGNHECASITRIYGFYDECKRRLNIRTWKRFVALFNWLPIAAVVSERILCVHGGLSPELRSLDDIRNIKRPTAVPDYGLLCDLLWSDPDSSVQGWDEPGKSVSFVFGANVIDDAIRRLDIDLICRGHQVVEEGYEFFSSGRRLVTVFSAPNYCGEFDNKGAAMLVDAELMCRFHIQYGFKPFVIFSA